MDTLSHWLEFFLGFWDEAAWFQFLTVITALFLIWCVMVKPVLMKGWSLLSSCMSFLNKKLQPIKCSLGFHNKSYGLPVEIHDTRHTRVNCSNPNCDWEDEHREWVR